MLRECVVLVLVCVFGAGSLSGRGLFCRDPETGQLHPENSTWTSSSFCGTYHCKVRRKNLTNTQYAPMRQINITTNIQPLAENATIEVVPKEDKSLVKKEEVVKNVTGTDNKTTIYNLIPHLVHSTNNTLKNTQGIKINDDIDDQNASEQDRYLTEKEIKSLTEILHTIKKGDLDAIVEIYNLAQDIYKELDQTSTDLVLREAVTAKTSERQIVTSELFKKLTQRDHASYFYDPLSNTKIRGVELLRPDVVNNELNPELPVMVIRNSNRWLDVPPPPANVVNGTMKGTTKKVPVGILSSIPIEKGSKSKKQKLSDEFFNSPLTHNDFGKLPYYYPISNFQRMSSYKHDLKKTLVGNTKAEVLALAPVPVTTLTPIPLRIQPESKPIQTHARVPAWITEPIPLRISETIPPQTHARMLAQLPKSKSDPKQPQRYAQIPARIPEQNSDPKSPRTYARIPARIPDPFQAHGRVPARVFDPISARKSEPRPSPMQERILVRLPPLLPEHLPARIPSRTQAPPPRRIPIRFPEPVPPRQPPLVSPKVTTSRPAPAPAPKSPHKPVKSKPVTTGTKYVKELRPSIFLPYPFTNMQQNNNWSFIQSLYNGDRVAKLEASRINGTPFKKLKFPYDEDNRNNLIIMKEREKQKQANVVLMNPDLENFQDLQIKASMNKETVAAANGKQSKNEDHRVPARRRPVWQTDSIPEHIIEEVRAHIQEKHRKFIHTLPFRKKVKLERVGTLFNMDQLTRTKREAEEKRNATETAPLEHEIYEVFIEKTTCDADYSVPGFFRYGNLSEPYPECCPQRIPPT